MAPLKRSKLTDRFLYVFFDTECTQNLKKHDGSFEHIPNLICAQQMCSKCEAVDDLNVDWKPSGNVLTCFGRKTPWVNLLIISGCLVHSRTRFMLFHITHGYDAQFLLRKFLELRWTPQLIMDGTKILSMIVENLYFLDSLNFLPMSLKSMPKLFDLTCKKGYYPHFFNTANNLDYGTLSRTQVLCDRVHVRR